MDQTAQMRISVLGIINSLVLKDSGSERVAKDVAYGASPRQRLDIYRPFASQEPRPVIVFLYGGGWSDGAKADYAFAGRALASLGYVVVVPDYRLVPEVEYPHFLSDCADAVEWVIGNIWQWGGDGSRLALVGHSAGAYNAVMLGVDPSLLEARGISPAVKCIAGLSGPYDFFPFDGRISLRVFGAVREPEQTQPIEYVRAGLPPMLLGTGGGDKIVLPRNSTAMAARLAEKGVEAELRLYPRLGHPGPLLALMRPARFIAPVLADLKAFLTRHLPLD